MSQPRGTRRATVVRRLRAALFHVRSVFVVVAMTLALAAWMLVGVIAAGISALFERRRARERKEPPPSAPPRVWTLPEWMQA